MAEEKVLVSHYRNYEYIVNYSNGDNSKTYRWAGAKNGKYDSKWIPKEVVDYLMMNGEAFESGELIVSQETPDVEEVLEGISDIEKYKANALSIEDVTALLQGNANKMKAELNKIEEKETKRFVVNVAKEIKLDSNAKLTFLAEWFGVKKSDLFDE